jgi:hypothetical protein
MLRERPKNWSASLAPVPEGSSVDEGPTVAVNPEMEEGDIRNWAARLARANAAAETGLGATSAVLGGKNDA